MAELLLFFIHSDYNDFPKIVQEIDLITVFPTRVSIDITDDDINEAKEQYFVVMLEVINVTNPLLVTIRQRRRFSLIRIIDDDSKWKCIAHNILC